MKNGLVIAGLVIFSGCTSFETPLEGKDDIRLVGDRVICEFRDAYNMQMKKGNTWLQNYAVSYLLTLKREDSINGGPHIGYKASFSHDRSFSLGDGASIGATGTGIRTITTKRQFKLADLPAVKNCPVAPPKMFRGSLGIGEGLEEALSAQGGAAAGPPFQNNLADLGYTISFEIKTSASVDPTFGIQRITGVGVNMGAYSDKTNTLDIAYTDATPRPQVIDVRVTNFPGQPGLVGTPPRPGAHKKPLIGIPQLLISPEVEDRLNQTINRLQNDRLQNRLR
ncbi:hypothetical protein [Rhizobium sp. BR 315]|uniref:hypothetical protein n=1 Tax=Rhizobium sp. BR 315 TaxID=3040014 RepID=UPI003D33B10D